MATPADQLDQIFQSTFDKWRPTLQDMTIKRSSVLAALELKSKVVEKGGKTIRQRLMYALNDTVKSYDGYDLFDTTPQGGFGHAVYDWRQVNGTVTISGKEKRINSGPEAFADLLEDKFEQLRLSFTRKFNEYIFALTPGAKDPLSLPALIGDSGIVGGIDSSAGNQEWWRSQVIAGPVDLTTTAGLRSLDTMKNNLYVNGASPDFEFTTQANYEAYVALATEKIRFVNTKMADLGFEAVAHGGAEVVFDPFVPQPVDSGGGRWYFISTDALELRVHPDANFTRLDTQRPYNQDAWNTPVIWMGNLVTGNRRAHGVILSTTV